MASFFSVFIPFHIQHTIGQSDAAIFKVTARRTTRQNMANLLLQALRNNGFSRKLWMRNILGNDYHISVCEQRVHWNAIGDCLYSLVFFNSVWQCTQLLSHNDQIQGLHRLASLSAHSLTVRKALGRLPGSSTHNRDAGLLLKDPTS